MLRSRHCTGPQERICSTGHSHNINNRRSLALIPLLHNGKPVAPQYVPASGQVLKIVAFALILILVIFALGALGKVIEATIKIVMLSWLNRLLGAIFSLLKYALVMGLIIMAFNALNNTFNIIGEDTLYASSLYPTLKRFAYSVFPYLKDLLFWGR